MDSSGYTPANELCELTLAVASLFPGTLDTWQPNAANRETQEQLLQTTTSDGLTIKAAPQPHHSTLTKGDATVIRDESQPNSKSSSAKDIDLFVQHGISCIRECMALRREQHIQRREKKIESSMESDDHATSAHNEEETYDNDTLLSINEDSTIINDLHHRMQRMNIRALCPHPGTLRLFPYACLQQSGILDSIMCKTCPLTMTI